LHEVPTDIEPIFVTAEELAPSPDKPSVAKAPLRKKAPAN
jgi:hypothetical protein